MTTHRSRRGVAMLLMLGIWSIDAAGCKRSSSIDDELAKLQARHGLRPVAEPPEVDPALVELGRALFFDRELSGNRDVACATCHHPAFATSDGQVLSVGVGGEGVGPARHLAEGREFAPRNAGSIFNLADPAWRTQFWDGRVERYEDGVLRIPASGALPTGVEGDLIAVQAMFPVTSRDEMRGERGDLDSSGAENELAGEFDSNTLAIWEGITARLLEIPGYVAMFERAYPGTSRDALHFGHAARAIAAFEIEAFTLTDSPWDRYLAGDRGAMTPAQKEGARLFFGEAGCGTCHTGALLTDQNYYNIGAIQLGPGKSPEAPLDWGRARSSMNPADRFEFRTPPLRNVADTAPYMHAGAYATLEGAIRHHVDPRAAWNAYDSSALPEDLAGTVLGEGAGREAILAGVAPELDAVPELSEAQIASLVTFLEALSSPSLSELGRWVPESVPSGLPVDVHSEPRR